LARIDICTEIDADLFRSVERLDWEKKKHHEFVDTLVLPENKTKQKNGSFLFLQKTPTGAVESATGVAEAKASSG
jgi:hypothetical protein